MLCDLGLDELSTTPPPGLTRQHVILAETKHANVLHTVVYGVDYQGTVRLNFYQTSPNSNNAGKGLACWVGGWGGGMFQAYVHCRRSSCGWLAMDSWAEHATLFLSFQSRNAYGAAG
jgi:hypothetical protein